MATALSLSTAQSMTISILQASQSPYATTVDGSNRQYSSSTEIDNAILTADGEICTLIARTIQSPYQTTFITTSSALPAPKSPLPARVGTILNVLTQAGATITFASTDVSVPNNYVTIANHGLVTGQVVQLTTSGSLPTGLSLATDYYIIRLSSSTFQFASTLWNASQGTAITMSGAGSGTNTVTSQYVEGTQADSKDTVIQAYYNPGLFAQSANGVANFWFIEGDEVYTSSPNCKVIYTDYTLTSAPQAPQPYLHAVVAGAVAELLKDGGSSEVAAYYQNQYQSYLQEISQGARVLPEIAEYKSNNP